MIKTPPPIPEIEADFRRETDVVVVGVGAAGAAAALGAAENGAAVVALERTGGPGGSSAFAAGYIYAGGGTEAQLRHGFKDTPENMLAFLTALSPQARPEVLAAFAQGSVEHLQWLRSVGVPLNEDYYPGRHIAHPTPQTLAWSGSEAAWPYSLAAEPMPRGHKVECVDGGGRLLVEALARRAQDAGVEIVSNARVTGLIVDSARRVIGARFVTEGRVEDVRARGGVVLATGGFEWNRAMAEVHAPEMALDGVVPLGAETADGAGILLGRGVGAGLNNMAGVDLASPWYPPAGLVRGILVNTEGRRFINEDVYLSRSTHAVMDQPGRRAFLICDNRVFERPDTPSNHRLIDAWETVAEMERDLGIPEGALQHTMADYNRHARLGQDPQWRKHPTALVPLEEPPFAAIDCSLGAAVFFALSMGGLAINADGAVLDDLGAPIPGLFAAGAMAPTIAFTGADYASGMMLGAGTFFGRRAGRQAARSRANAEAGSRPR